MTARAISSHSVLPPASPTPTVNQSKKCNDNFIFSDKLVQQLLSKLDQGTSTIINLRSLLNNKTVELNELISQLELIDQVLTNVENGTEQIELVLKDVIKAGKDKLLDAEATLDSAIQSASSLSYYTSSSPVSLCSTPFNYNNSFSYSHDKEKQILLNKINELIAQFDIDSSQFFANGSNSNKKADTEDELEVLQKAYIDLGLARTIASTIKSDLKHRSTLINKNNASIDEIKQLTDKIKNQVKLYKSYTRNAAASASPLNNVVAILDREEHALSISKKQTYTMHSTIKQQAINKKKLIKPHPYTNTTTTTIVNNNPYLNTNNIHNSTKPTTKTKSLVHNFNNKPLLLHTTTTQTTNKQNLYLQLISRHTSSSKAKSKEPKWQEVRPGSTLRIRNMLSKRQPIVAALRVN